MWSKIRVPGWRGAGLAVIAAVAGVVVAPGPVGSAAADTRPAAVSCYYICDGTDPNKAVFVTPDERFIPCTNDARTIYTHDPEGTGYVELRYSRRCRIAWARGGLHGVMIQGFNADGSFRTSYAAGGSDHIGVTAVVNDAGLTARACIFYPQSGGQYTCGPRY
ncbi:DUF2690 domain-containing protein [Lentzea terrae]|uniref:DUF2690 domain-containing protein n=1 Tax=Lentzea terrae TaxID=2200761 RepID=UPI0013002018|nr:DUF2690 domain-containing protein [Lentzea terrae]